MKNFKRILVTLVAAVLLMAVTVAGTLAYLQATTDAVVNTFTYGKVNFAGLGLDETDVDVYGVKDGDERVRENDYKLLPGHTYTKDPTVHILAGSEPCWVFIKVENGIANIEDSANTIAAQMTTNGWLPLKDADGNDVANVYYYKEIIDLRETETNRDLQIFANFKLTNSLDEAAIQTYEGAEIWIDAYLIQSDNLTSAAAAWAVAQPDFAKPVATTEP